MIIKKKLFQDHPLVGSDDDYDSPSSGIMVNLLMVGKSANSAAAAAAPASSSTVVEFIDDNGAVGGGGLVVVGQPSPPSRDDVMNQPPPSLTSSLVVTSSDNIFTESTLAVTNCQMVVKKIIDPLLFGKEEKNPVAGHQPCQSQDLSSSSSSPSTTTRDAETLTKVIVNHPNGDHPYCNLSGKKSKTTTTIINDKKIVEKITVNNRNRTKRTGTNDSNRKKKRSKIDKVENIIASESNSVKLISSEMINNSDLNSVVWSMENGEPFLISNNSGGNNIENFPIMVMNNNNNSPTFISVENNIDSCPRIFPNEPNNLIEATNDDDLDLNIPGLVDECDPFNGYFPYGHTENLENDFYNEDLFPKNENALGSLNSFSSTSPPVQPRQRCFSSPMMNNNRPEPTLTQVNSIVNEPLSNHHRTSNFTDDMNNEAVFQTPTIEQNMIPVQNQYRMDMNNNNYNMPIPQYPNHSSPMPAGQQQQYNDQSVLNFSGPCPLVPGSNDQSVPNMAVYPELPPTSQTNCQTATNNYNNRYGGYGTGQMANGQTSFRPYAGNRTVDRERNHSMSTDISYDEGFASHEDDDNSDNNSEPNIAAGAAVANNQQQQLGHYPNQIQAGPLLQYHQMMAPNGSMVKQEEEVNNYGQQEWIAVAAAGQPQQLQQHQENHQVMNSQHQPDLEPIAEQDEDESDDGDDDDDDSFYGKYEASDLIDANLSGDVNNKWSLNMGRSRKSSDKRYFWQYNVQSKGPKGPRIDSSASMENGEDDPHVFTEIADPVFAPDCQVEGVKHNGKARRGDGNDLTPNPKKLVVIGLELKKLSKTINDLAPMTEVPATCRNNSRKEKNKLASRACRLKKKAQHEANKIKLCGLKIEHTRSVKQIRQLRDAIQGAIRYLETGQIVKIDLSAGDQYQPPSSVLLTNTGELQNIAEQICQRNRLRIEVAGKTPDFVNHILDNVTKGANDGGLNDLG